MKFRSLAVAAFTLAASSLFADTFVVDKSHSEATFQVRHMMSKVSGKFDDFSGKMNLDRAKPTASSVEFNIKAASVNTGTADRDKHLQTADFFDVARCPEITFKSTSIAATKKKNVYDVTGDLTMRCVTKHITIPVEFNGFGKDPWGNERAGFSLTTTVNRKDYGINWNKALDNGGFLVSDEVTINVNLEAQKSK
ncbi:MAG: polyisoprenoid-binding protein [Acidobacteria bacterium]|nr:polyisoprenoid-binding protein [Acidobacteriota bacterium]MBV9068150.1 polyisoprenoid-binding protein [Acidobacteriota bacterium]MBV9186412.1 polyisoprenoid-binding protein [Acidobacteriota bacterium]